MGEIVVVDFILRIYLFWLLCESSFLIESCFCIWVYKCSPFPWFFRLFFSFLVGVWREYWPSPFSPVSWWFFLVWILCLELFVFSLFWQLSEAEFLGRLFSTPELLAEWDWLEWWLAFEFACSPFAALFDAVFRRPELWELLLELDGLFPLPELLVTWLELVDEELGPAAALGLFAALLELSAELCTEGALLLAELDALTPELAKHSRNQHAIDSSHR